MKNFELKIKQIFYPITSRIALNFFMHIALAHGFRNYIERVNFYVQRVTAFQVWKNFSCIIAVTFILIFEQRESCAYVLACHLSTIILQIYAISSPLQTIFQSIFYIYIRFSRHKLLYVESKKLFNFHIITYI